MEHVRPLFCHGIIKRLTFQALPGIDGNGHIRIEHSVKAHTDLGNALFHLLFAVALKDHRKSVALPDPASTGQRTTGHGVFLRKQGHKVLGGNVYHLICRVCSDQIHIGKAVDIPNLFPGLFQAFLRNIAGAVDMHLHRPAYRIDIRAFHLCVQQKLPQGLLGLVFGKHIKQENAFFHMDLKVLRFFAAMRAEAGHKAAWLPALLSQTTCRSRRRRQCRYRPPGLHRGH